MRASSEYAHKTKEKGRELRASSVHAHNSKEKGRELCANYVNAQKTGREHAQVVFICQDYKQSRGCYGHK
ncbi:hypothetical protein MKX78_05820 [Cytobacillus sp. FSL R5-0569]|uniref:hypothetical protein n=1 Tax=Cytobacillus sp. FSL R5-0569 TaxID=2921649 RepID=UPI0030F71C7E